MFTTAPFSKGDFLLQYKGDFISAKEGEEREEKYPKEAGNFLYSGLDISARPLAQASVKSVGRVQITDHSPVWRVRFFIAKKLIKLHNIYSVLPTNL